jgi:hypothetical protein
MRFRHLKRRALRLTYDIRHPDLARLALCAAMKNAAASAVLCSAFPVYNGVLEARVDHDVSNLRNAVHPPIVGEDAATFSLSLSLKREVKTSPVRNGIKLRLLKIVLHARQAFCVDARMAVLRSPKDIDDE